MFGQQALTAALVGASLFLAQGALAADEAPDAPAANGRLYQNVRSATCSGGQCVVTFQRVPAGKILETTNLSCQAESGANGVPATFAKLDTDRTLTFMTLVPYQFNGTYALSTGALSGSVFVGNNRAPKVTIINALDATCTLSGRLIAE